MTLLNCCWIVVPKENRRVLNIMIYLLHSGGEVANAILMLAMFKRNLVDYYLFDNRFSSLPYSPIIIVFLYMYCTSVRSRAAYSDGHLQ